MRFSQMRLPLLVQLSLSRAASVNKLRNEARALGRRPTGDLVRPPNGDAGYPTGRTPYELGDGEKKTAA